jgi:hypothetical protein
MIRFLVLTLALTLGDHHDRTPSAHACGGYVLETPERRAIRAAIHIVADRRFGAETPVTIVEVTTDGDVARATVLVTRASGVETHRATLRRRDGAWRVLGLALEASTASRVARPAAEHHGRARSEPADFTPRVASCAGGARGKEIEWNMPGGKRRLRVLAVTRTDRDLQQTAG